jgi:hypothetical protein
VSKLASLVSLDFLKEPPMKHVAAYLKEWMPPGISLKEMIVRDGRVTAVWDTPAGVKYVTSHVDSWHEVLSNVMWWHECIIQLRASIGRKRYSLKAK